MEKVTVTEAAMIIDATPEFVRMAMQQGRLPIGSAAKLSVNRWTYNISPKLLAEYSGADVEAELKRIRKGV